MSTLPHRRLTLRPKQVLGLILVALCAVLAAENTARTRVRFIVPVVTAPLWLALVAPLVLGFAAGALFVHRRR